MPVINDQLTREGRLYRSRRQVAQRYGVHLRTIRRWYEAGLFPDPDFVINDRPYWAEQRLDEHDRQCAIETAIRGRPAKAAATPA